MPSIPALAKQGDLSEPTLPMLKTQNPRSYFQPLALRANGHTANTREADESEFKPGPQDCRNRGHTSKT